MLANGGSLGAGRGKEFEAYRSLELRFKLLAILICDVISTRGCMREHTHARSHTHRLPLLKAFSKVNYKQNLELGALLGWKMEQDHTVQKRVAMSIGE